MNTNISISAGDDSYVAMSSGNDMVGDNIVGGGKNPVAWGASAIMGFVPLNPLYIPFQIAMIVVFSIIFIGMFGMGVPQGLLGAYLAQALIVMFLSEWILDKLINWGKKSY